jgi:hypothetical protein
LPPNEIFNDSGDCVLGDFNAFFSFDSQWDYTGLGGVLMTLDFTAKVSTLIPDFTLSISGMANFDDETYAFGTEYGFLPGTSFVTDAIYETIIPFSTPRYGDVNEDGIINAADVTALRRYISNGGNAAGLAGFNAANADVNGDGVINATDVTLLRRHVGAQNPSRVPLGPWDKNVTIDVFVETTWAAQFPNNRWQTQAENIMASVTVPFKEQFGITLVPTVRPFLNWSICSNPASCSSCRLSITCSSNHHRSSKRALAHNQESLGALSIIIVGHQLCDCIIFDSSHSYLEGQVKDIGVKGAVARGYFRGNEAIGFSNSTDNEYYWHTVRLIQHELSHNYGARHCTHWRCIMSAFTLWYDTDDRTDIWCNPCRTSINRNLY